MRNSWLPLPGIVNSAHFSLAALRSHAVVGQRRRRAYGKMSGKRTSERCNKLAERKSLDHSDTYDPPLFHWFGAAVPFWIPVCHCLRVAAPLLSERYHSRSPSPSLSFPFRARFASHELQRCDSDALALPHALRSVIYNHSQCINTSSVSLPIVDSLPSPAASAAA